MRLYRQSPKDHCYKSLNLITVKACCWLVACDFLTFKPSRLLLGDRLLNGGIGPLSVLSVTLMYCGQTVLWIKMPPLHFSAHCSGTAAHPSCC